MKEYVIDLVDFPEEFREKNIAIAKHAEELGYYFYVDYEDCEVGFTDSCIFIENNGVCSGSSRHSFYSKCPKNILTADEFLKLTKEDVEE